MIYADRVSNLTHKLHDKPYVVRSAASSEYSASSEEELRNAHTDIYQDALRCYIAFFSSTINIHLYINYSLYQTLLVRTHITMSDGALVSSLSEWSAPQSSDSSNGSFAFYIHSQDTVNHSLPLHEDRKAYARQRRRRTRYVLSCGYGLARLFFNQ